MADERGPEGDDNAQERPDEEVGDSRAGESGASESGPGQSDASQPGAEDITRRDPRESPFGLPLRGGGPGSGADPTGGLPDFSALGSLAGLGGLGGPGGPDGGDLASMLEQVLGEAASNPELAEIMRSMGVDP